MNKPAIFRRYNQQNLALTLWAFAKLEHRLPDQLTAAASERAADSLHECNPQVPVFGEKTEEEKKKPYPDPNTSGLIRRMLIRRILYMLYCC